MLALLTVMLGLFTTVTVLVAVLVQVLTSVPVTVYTVVLPGLAITEFPLVALKPEAGLHAYVFAPLAFKFILPPLQTVPLFTETCGIAFTVTVVVFAFEQLLASVPVTV